MTLSRRRWAQATLALPCVDRFSRGLPLWIVQSPQGEAAKPPPPLHHSVFRQTYPPAAILPHNLPIPPQGGLQANSGGGRRVWPLPATQVRVRAGWGERPQSVDPRAVPKTGTPGRIPSHYLLLTRRKPSRGPSSQVVCEADERLQWSLSNHEGHGSYARMASDNRITGGASACPFAAESPPPRPDFAMIARGQHAAPPSQANFAFNNKDLSAVRLS